MRAKVVITICLVLGFGINNSKAQDKIDWEVDLQYEKSYLEIMHPHLFDFVTEEEFDRDFNYLLDNWHCLIDADIVARLTEIFMKIQDGHTGVSLVNGNDYIKGLFHYCPVWLYKFNDGYFELYTRNEYKELVGKKITKLGDLGICHAINQMMRFQVGDNKWGKIQYIPLIQEFIEYTGITARESDQLFFQYEDYKGEPQEYWIEEPESLMDFYLPSKVFPQKDTMVYAMNEGGFSVNNYWYIWLPEQETIYLQISNNTDKPDDPFGAFCKRMFHNLDSINAKKLIVDVRLNAGGNHFEMPLIKGIIARPDIDSEGNLFLITGRRTISASEHLTTQMEIYTNVSHK